MEGQFEDIDLRIRMKLLRCERYKTFQEDPLNKKYPAKEKNNYQSIHRLKVLFDDDSNLSKANQTRDQAATEEDEIETEAAEGFPSSVVFSESHVENESKSEEIEEEAIAEEEIPEEIPTQEDPEANKGHTGVFRDNKRRIDIVLVVEDEAAADTDHIKLDFLMNILRIGLQIEIEPGLMEINKKKYFVKIHAPESVLKEYGNMFAVKRYFVNNHMASNNIYCKSHEAEWLKMIRSNYTTSGGYSNYERSLIVYKILRHLPFGDHVNQYGLHRLLTRNIILDAYALHDGPYFYVSNNTTKGTQGRQILYYNWVGLQNIFRSQPLHIIHEYYGPKIAFYYAFYGFYNAVLMLASLAGFVSVLIPYLARKEPQAMIKKLCESGSDSESLVGVMCPECRSERCVKRPYKDYCIPIILNVHLDHPYVIYFSVYMILWAFIFISIWRRKEYVLNWIWEVGGRDSYYKTSKRPEFKFDYYNPRTKARTGLTYDESELYKVIRILISLLFIPLCIIASLAIMTDCRDIYDKFADLFVSENSTKVYEYYVLATFGTVYTIVITLFEFAFHFLCYPIVKLENHKSYKEYENALISKQFGCSVTLMYSFICLFAWLVGNQNIHYGRCQFENFSALSGLFHTLQEWIKTPWYIRTYNWYKSLYFGPECFRYCWPFTCINEVNILLFVMLFVKQVIFRVVFNTYRLTTDYNQARKMNVNIPCWEREFMLNEFNEKDLTRRYMVLALQFSLITMFVIAFPLAPLLVLIVNVWDIRHSARKLLLASRRPLLIRSPGIGAWNNIFLFIAYAAIVTNFLTLLLTTRQNLREYFQKPLNDSVFNFLLFGHMLDEPAPIYIVCDAPYLLIYNHHFEEDYFYNWVGVTGYRLSGGRVGTRREFYFLNLILLKAVSVYVLSLLCLAFIVQYIFKPYLRGIEECKIIESKIKNLYSYYDRKNNKSNQ